MIGSETSRSGGVESSCQTRLQIEPWAPSKAEIADSLCAPQLPGDRLDPLLDFGSANRELIDGVSGQLGQCLPQSHSLTQNLRLGLFQLGLVATFVLRKQLAGTALSQAGSTGSSSQR